MGRGSHPQNLQESTRINFGQFFPLADMTKKIACILAVLPLVGIGWLMLGHRSVPANNASVPSVPQNRESATPTIARTTEKKPFYTPEELAEAIESHKRTEASLARLAKATTPEIRKQLVDARMRRFAKSHADLFESWNLEAETTEEMLRIVREREERLGNIQQKRNESGSINAKEYLQNREIEYKMAEIQLANLLGEDRYRQLSKAEAEESGRNAGYVRAKVFGQPEE